MSDEIKNSNPKKMKSKPPAVSHMFWFFIIPAIVFISWVSFHLAKNLSAPAPKMALIEKVEKIHEARSSGDRWQSAYSMAETLQKDIQSGDFKKLSQEEKNEFFSKIDNILEENKTDARLLKYMLLTLGQIGDLKALEIVKPHLKSENDDIKFFSSWAYVNLLQKNKDKITPDQISVVEEWLQGEDLAYQKIATSFLVQQGPQYREKVKPLLNDQNTELRWNTAVALASMGDKDSVATMLEIFNLKALRDLDLRSAQDLQQLLASAFDAAVKLKDEKVLQAAHDLKASVDNKTPEGRAIHQAIRE